MHKNSLLEALNLRTSRSRLTLTALLLLTACGQVSLSADQHIAQAQQAYAEGDVRAAIIEIKNALQQDPSQAEARRLLGEYSIAIGNGVEAEAELIRAQDLGADPDLLRLPLLRAWLMQGKTDQVLTATEPDQPVDSAQRPELLTLRGLALLAQQNTDQARATFQEAVALDPNNAEALVGMAWVSLLEEDRDASRSYLKTALESDLESSRAWELLGDVERDDNQFDAAEAAYSKAMETTNQPFSPRFKRALTRVFQQDYEGAEKDLQVMRKQSAQNPAVSYLSGLIAFNQQQFEQARTALEEALALQANYMPAVFYLGATHYALENWEQAASYLSRYTAVLPASPEANRLLALTRLRDGDSERAERALNAVLQTNPEDQATLTMMSNLFLAQGRADEALHHLRKVIALEPDSATTRAQIGLALVQKGEREQGFTELEQALELAPESSTQLEIAMIMERLRAKEYEQAHALIEGLKQRADLNPVIYYNLKGLTYIAQNDTKNAEAIFREGLEKAPDANADLASNLAGILARDGRVDEARELANAYLEENPEHLGLLSNLARLNVATGNTEQAEDLLKRAVTAHPHALQPRRGLAELYLQTDRAEEAVILLREDEQTHRDSPDWLRSMAQALIANSDREAAIDTLRRLKNQQPEQADVSLMLGRLLIDQGRLDEGRSALEEGLQQQPDHLGARLILVELLTREGKFERATEMLVPAQQAHPNHPEVLGRAGAIAYGQGQMQEAIAAFQQALEQTPEDRRLVGALARAQHDAGDTAKAAAILADWLENHPEDDQMRLMQANWLLALERNDEAITAYQRVLERSPETPLALNNLAWLIREQDPTEALSLATRAVEIAPKTAALLDTKGVIEMQVGDYDQAVTSLGQAIELAPESAAIRLHLAKALRGAGQDAQAQEQLETLIAQHPQTPEHDEATRLLRP